MPCVNHPYKKELGETPVSISGFKESLFLYKVLKYF
jgi:hypothetical protein